MELKRRGYRRAMSASTEAGPHDSAAAPHAHATAIAGPRAGFGRRLGAALIDGILLTLVFWILVAILPVGAAYAIYLLGSIAYYTALEGGPTGQTLGKKAVGIRVYDLRNGGPIGYGRAFVRWIGRIVSTVVIFIGYLWMLWDPQKQTWHDKMAGSVVVPTSEYPV